MKKFLYILAAAALLLATASICGCSASPLSGEELKTTAAALIDASAEINEIYFGDGLPCDTPEDFTPTTTPRYFMSTDEKYTCTGDIKSAAAKVYSAEYCEYINSVAFEGFNTDAGTVYARYIDSEAGYLTVRGGLSDEAATLGRTYDYSTVKEVSHTASSVTFTVDSTGADGRELNVKLTLVQEKDGWRLDTPTY